MTLALGNITVDCDDTLLVATFWSAALDRPIDDEPSEGFASIGREDPSQTGWFFIKVPEGKAVKNRLHLDVSPVDRSTEDEVARLLALGATRTDVGQGADRSWVVMADPEGNEFCVLRTLAP